MSKNYQIKYSIKADDLTEAGVRKAIANLKKLADAQKNIDKERILNKQKILAKIAADKLSKQKSSLDKQEERSELARYAQLLGRKSLMEKTQRLRRLKGDEDGLRKYRETQQGILTKLQNKFFDKGDYKGKAANLAEQLAVQGRLNRSEFMLGSAIDANNRRREQSVKALERQAKMQERVREREARQQERLKQQASDRRSSGEVAIGAASGAALYGGARSSIYSFGQAMTLEQMGISMRAQFGVDQGNKATKEMKDYARDTAFTLKEATQLLLGVKIGAKNIGITKTDDIIGFTKQIGKSILAYGGNVEDRYEIGHQLSQIFMSGSANTRQDLKVIARRGLPIFEALTAMTGKNYKQLQAQYGSELPASLIANAILFMSKSEAVQRSAREREISFTQAFESSSEQFGYTAGAFGDMLAKAIKLPSLLRGFTSAMSKTEDLITGNGNADKTSTSSQLLMLGVMSTGMALSILTLKGALTAAGLAFKYFTGNAITLKLALSFIAGFIPTLIGSFASGGLVYAAFADWKGLLDDINKDGLKGFLNHISLAVAGVATLAGIIAMTLTGNFVGAGALAIGALGTTAYKTMQWGDDKAWADLRKSMNPNNPTMPIPNMTPLPKNAKNGDTNVYVDTRVDAATGNTKTKVRVDPYNNPVFSGAWAN